ncbi:lipoate--protein ligase family protein [Paenibacillus lemnae]|uniref:Lipoate--protein ligase family protein n=1 Tax=Paenibacillus lemnae TaxID=1330551 RepID=A0A848M0T0_PAELE|nr:lipoate--protein ligase family protein [Paenibacillus lemnae]NMO94447.1 lipoate--protein ligase family protein [Paenibacillus lemnae]
MNQPFMLPEEAGPVLLLDRSTELHVHDVLGSFALDELLGRQTGMGGPAICHIWRHPQAFVMGVRDSRLPFAEQAAVHLRRQGYDTAVRHSGGAAVPLDAGVVNLSLILPLGSGKENRDFHPAFQWMAELISEALKETGRRVDTGEIKGAFCPGTFDLSINGRKFCGIAQRRQSKALIVQAFVICEGSGSERAALVRSFYNQAAESVDLGDYPQVVSESTASLQELAGMGSLASLNFTNLIKGIIRGQQDHYGPSAMEDAASRLQLPSPEVLSEMTSSLRQRYTS